MSEKPVKTARQPKPVKTARQPKPVKTVAFADFVREHENAAESLGAVVVSISHPDAATGIHTGRYSGIRTTEGDLSAKYSDGTTH